MGADPRRPVSSWFPHSALLLCVGMRSSVPRNRPLPFRCGIDQRPAREGWCAMKVRVRQAALSSQLRRALISLSARFIVTLRIVTVCGKLLKCLIVEYSIRVYPSSTVSPSADVLDLDIGARQPSLSSCISRSVCFCCTGSPKKQ
jgi:hypothetical protein